ncbi:FAD-binding oxidoreductase [Microvirga sp. ACRRW]|uniref:NAD(P)/FAD-dependent oxidoreductase n=1 Tax=Microvirga sp. ACRRW TaxID=2918205 RepID=UPI001EF4A00C|nr:FAD-dependent oxidoreductase [Microvirga sp. ACRRW]MCG7393825.1 FAD-binding oxidoreductase [Microvirga sp. ACRRW]
MHREPDIVVIGGGLMGACVAWGLARRNLRVCVLDEGDIALRASRANFALIWVQGKGLGFPAYAAWTKTAAADWPRFAADLESDTGIDVGLDQPGGFTLCLSDRELQASVDALEQLREQSGALAHPYEVLDHAQTKMRLPAIGPDVTGAIYCPLDGHVNSLRLFRALHAALLSRGVDYRAEHAVDTVEPRDGVFIVKGTWGEIRAPKVVLAAGLGNAGLAPMVGLDAPMKASRGQIVVTEKASRFLRYPIVTLRQTDEGGVMIGDSEEANGASLAVDHAISSVMADRAIRMFPLLADLNVVRTWSAFRVMTLDGYPIYDQSQAYPGAFIAMAHSGVTLASRHATILADAIAAGTIPEEVSAFATRRFHVSACA